MTHRSINSAVLAVLVALSGLPVTAWAGTQCDTFFFAGETQQPGHDQPFVGGMTLTNLQTGSSYDAEVVTMLLGYTSSDMSGAVTSHEIRAAGSPGIDLVTFDQARLEPTGEPGVLKLVSHLVVKTGSGAYNCGEMGTDFANSTLEFDAQGLGTATYSGLARLCRCRPSDN